MDPVSAIGLTAAVISSIDACTRGFTPLLSLQSRYQQTDLTIRILLTQLSTLKAALVQISEWIHKIHDAFPYDHVLDLHISLDGSKFLVDTLHDRLVSFEREENDHTSPWQKTRFLWEERERATFQTMLNHQITALNLFLTALQWYDSSSIDFST
jgi:hypothetical protein